MSGNSKIVSIVDRKPDKRSRLKEMDALLNLDVPADRFLAELLALQCRFAGAKGGVMLRPGENKSPDILALCPLPPTGDGIPGWIVRAQAAALEVILSGETLIVPVSDMQPALDASADRLILIPVQDAGTVRAVAAFLVQAQSPAEMDTCRERLEITPFVLDHYELRLSLNNRNPATDRLRLVLEVVAVLNRSDRFISAAMALCNELASRMHCSRVSLGVNHDRHVRVQAISHTDRFRREMQLINDIEAAMEECLDQDLEVIHPAAETALYASRITAKLSKNHGSAAVLSLPIRQNGDVFAVLTLERPVERPFDILDQIEALRLICDLCAPRLFEMHARDRWFGARSAAWAREHLGRLVGPEHTWMKAGVMIVLALFVFITFVKGDYRIEASFKFEAPLQQAVVAPFDTFIKSVAVDPGDEVIAGHNILGLLDASDLRLQLAALRAEELGHEKQRAASMRDGKTVEAQIAEAQSAKTAAEIRLLEQKIAKAKLVAPITGRIVSEDLKRQIGAPVETGKILFEIARIESLRAELYVAEESIARVQVGQHGELASVSHPDQRIRFVVERINPMAEVINNTNVFRVRGRLQKQYEWMRPGMEGIAKIFVAQKPYIWIATHRIANWLRMKLWF